MLSAASSSPTLPPVAFALWLHPCGVAWDAQCCSRTVVVIKGTANTSLYPYCHPLTLPSTESNIRDILLSEQNTAAIGAKLMQK